MSNNENGYGFEQKHSLSSDEVKKFREIIETDKINKQARNVNYLLRTDLCSEEIMKTISANRRAYAEALMFDDEEMNALISLGKVDQDEQIKFICFHFLFTVLDHKFIVEEKIGIDEALDGKFLILLGISDFKYFSDSPQNTVLYDMLFLLKSYNYYAYNTIYNAVSTSHINNANDLLSSLGSVLSISAHDKENESSSNSMYFNCTLKELRPPNTFSYFISDTDANKLAFRKVYDFYFQRKVKPAFDSIIAPKKGTGAQELINKSKEKVLKAKTQHFEKLITKYNSALDMKLKNLVSKRNKKDIL